MNHLNYSNAERNEWYRYLLVIAASALAMFTIGSAPLAFLLYKGIDITTYANKNILLPILLFGHITFLVVAVALIKIVHGRSWTQVVNGSDSVRWSRFFFGFGIWGAFSIAGLAIGYCTNPENYIFSFDPIRFGILLIVSSFMIPVQATAEEFFFRGYLAQGIAYWTGKRWCALLIPAILFGLLHNGNPEVKEYGFWLMMMQYIFMGLMLGLMSIMDDGIELAMGVHAVNNLFIALFTTNDKNAFQTDALFKTTTVYPLQETLILFIFGIVVLGLMAVKYKWSFKRKVLHTIEFM